jgi:hypothetical protein
VKIYFMEPLLNDEGCRLMQDSLKRSAIFLDYIRRNTGQEIYDGWNGKEIDVDALIAEAFPERAKKK